MSLVLKGFKYRIYPNKEQKLILAQHFGSTRFVFNLFLNKRIQEYETAKTSSSYVKDSQYLTTIKDRKNKANISDNNQDGYQWLNNVNSQSIQAALKDLDNAYKNFFKKKAKFPNFRSKSSRQCVKIPQNFKVSCGTLKIPKVKQGIKIKLHRSLPLIQKCLYISKTKSGEYYASFLCEIEVESLPYNQNYIGVDLGIKDLAITSKDEIIKNNHYLRSKECDIKYCQRQLSKKKKGSNNRNKARIKFAKLHQNIKNKRLDHIHKLTSQLINENQVVICENLRVKNMMKNHCLAKSISDVSWSEIFRQLEYKSKYYGRIFHQVNTFYASSKLCSNCGYKYQSLSLKIRKWTCPQCGQQHNRDVNAAINIREQGLRDLEKVGLWNIIPDQKHVEALSAPDIK